MNTENADQPVPAVGNEGGAGTTCGPSANDRARHAYSGARADSAPSRSLIHDVPLSRAKVRPLVPITKG